MLTVSKGVGRSSVEYYPVLSVCSNCSLLSESFKLFSLLHAVRNTNNITPTLYLLIYGGTSFSASAIFRSNSAGSILMLSGSRFMMNSMAERKLIKK
jgi:hypothetical protein